MILRDFKLGDGLVRLEKVFAESMRVYTSANRKRSIEIAMWGILARKMVGNNSEFVIFRSGVKDELDQVKVFMMARGE